jgi:hypothetical protein
MMCLFFPEERGIPNSQNKVIVIGVNIHKRVMLNISAATAFQKVDEF